MFFSNLYDILNNKITTCFLFRFVAKEQLVMSIMERPHVSAAEHSSEEVCRKILQQNTSADVKARVK